MADMVREYVLNHRLVPEVRKGGLRVDVLAKEVAKSLGIHNRYPLIVNALTNKKAIAYINSSLRELSLCVAKVTKEGPNASPNTRIIYEFGPCPEPGGVGTRAQVGGVGRRRERPSEDWVRGIISAHLGIELRPGAVVINGKPKHFDLLNEAEHVVGDIKVFMYGGSVPAAEHDNLFVYTCLMEKLEKYSGTKWRKLIVGAGRKKTFQDFAWRYGPWLPEDLEIYFVNRDGTVERIR